jgi:hypothetical protein
MLDMLYVLLLNVLIFKFIPIQASNLYQQFKHNNDQSKANANGAVVSLSTNNSNVQSNTASENNSNVQ